MVAIPDSDMPATKQAFMNGKETFETLVQIYNIVIAGLKEIEDHDPEKCAEWLEEKSYPLNNQQMVELLYFMQEIIDTAKEKM